MSERMFPIQSQRSYHRPHPLNIPWSVAEKAYSRYSAEYGREQSLECLAERGGFGPGEMDDFHPAWIKEASEIERLLGQQKVLLNTLRSALTSLSQVASYEVPPIIVRDVAEMLNRVNQELNLA